MGRYRGTVERVRQELRATGLGVRQTRKLAPQLAEMRQAAVDRQTRPYPWLGARAHEATAAGGWR